MNELDDRLVGDPVWELFPARAATLSRASRIALSARWLAWACAVVVIWLLSPPVAIVMAGLVVSAGDFRNARQLAISIPDRAGGAICALFGCAWGVWKFAMTALTFLIAIDIWGGIQPEMSSAFVTSLLVALCGHVLSAMLTAAGLIGAYRSDMRVWIGEGVNRARLLLLAMLLVVFTFAVIGPVCFWLAMSPRPSGVAPLGEVALAVLGMSVGGALVLLLILDWLCARRGRSPRQVRHKGAGRGEMGFV